MGCEGEERAPFEGRERTCSSPAELLPRINEPLKRTLWGSFANDSWKTLSFPLSLNQAPTPPPPHTHTPHTPPPTMSAVEKRAASFAEFAAAVEELMRQCKAVLAHVDLDDCLVHFPPFTGCEGWYQAIRAAVILAEKLLAIKTLPAVAAGNAPEPGTPERARLVADALAQARASPGLEVSSRGKAQPFADFLAAQLRSFRRWLGPELCSRLAEGQDERLFVAAAAEFSSRDDFHAFSERVRESIESALLDPDAPAQLRRVEELQGAVVEINTSRGPDSRERTEAMLRRVGMGHLAACVHFKEEGRRVGKGEIAVRRALELASARGLRDGEAVGVALVDDRPDYVAQLAEAVGAHNSSAAGAARPIHAVGVHFAPDRAAAFDAYAAAAEARKNGGLFDALRRATCRADLARDFNLGG